MLRRGMQITKDAYDRDGLKGVLADQAHLFRAIWHTSLNTPIVSQSVTVPAPQELGIFRTAEILAGRYEQGKADLVEKYAPDASSIVELGGGIGFVTALTDQTTDDIRKHIVLEMNPQLLPILREVANVTRLDVHIDSSAYSAKSETVGLEQSTSYTQMSVSEKRGDEGAICAKSLSALIDEYDLYQFALIADIEGAERGLFEEEFDTMVEHCPVVIMELHRSRLGKDLTPYLEKLQSEYVLEADRDPVFAFCRTD